MPPSATPQIRTEFQSPFLLPFSPKKKFLFRVCRRPFPYTYIFIYSFRTEDLELVIAVEVCLKASSTARSDDVRSAVERYTIKFAMMLFFLFVKV